MAVRLPGLWGTPRSVLDRWHREADATGIISVTDPEMTRAVASVEDAASVLLSFARAPTPGDVVVPSYRAYRLGDLATVIAELHNARMHVVGPRTGEKQHEDLIAEEERHFARLHPAGAVIRFDRRAPGVPALSSVDLQRFTVDELRELVRRDRVGV